MKWLLERIEIEGFRGINNAGAPLVLTFDTNAVNSVFAPNGSGKSSIFEAVTYALTGTIPKLASLPVAENGGAYYLNQFHPGGVGTISLVLEPETGGSRTIVTVTRNKNGDRTVSTNDGSDGVRLLEELNREFVLLDSKTFQEFIDETALNRGRSFAGLLGLSSYSVLRQAFQSLTNTTAFNNHFDFKRLQGQKKVVEQRIVQARNNIRASYVTLVGEDLGSMTNSDLCVRAHGILSNIPVLQPECTGREFHDISLDNCVGRVRAAEGGAERERLTALLKSEAGWQEKVAGLPPALLLDELVRLASALQAALEKTQGDKFLRLYGVAEEILELDEWPDKTICPTCDRGGDTSVLDHVETRLSPYEEFENTYHELLALAEAVDWDQLSAAERATVRDGETLIAATARQRILSRTFMEPAATELRHRVEAIRSRATEGLESTVAEKLKLESQLPPSLVAVTEKIEAARRLQVGVRDEDALEVELASINAALLRIEHLRHFLDVASKVFSAAESAASARRLAAVEPLSQKLFAKIIFDPMVPAVSKPAGSEELQISLESFHGLNRVSARALLAESQRNAFAISVYLAAASLYGGAAKFLLLDDVTSSLDAGHQFHLMEVIRTQFSRPMTASGPQVVLLSHDTLLEKYFNTNGTTSGWKHQRIEGTPRTEILPQSNAVNRVRDSTIALLQAGNAQDAAPRVRQYLEYVLEDIVVRCRIPVPMDIALSDDKHLARSLILAIDAQIKLHSGANLLVLEPAQVANLNLSIATISANFLSHWSTGQSQAFAPGALLGVMQAIDGYADCFKFQPNQGAARQFYRSLSQR